MAGIGAPGRDVARATLPSTIELLRDLPVGALLVDESGAVIVANDRLRALWGDLPMAPSGALTPADAHHPDGRPVAPADWPIRRSLELGEVLTDIPLELERPNGGATSVLVSSQPLDRDGRRIGALMLVVDASPTREAGQLREAFVSVLSHELRTPITSIYSGVALLERHRLDETARSEILHDVSVEAESLYRIVEDLLVMVRLERGAALPRLEPVLIQRVAALALADERRRWPEHVFVASFPPYLPPVSADEGLLRQVLRNLLSNAAKYGGPGGRVGVRGSMGRGEVVVQVTDEGPGIQAGDRDQVFALFYRGGDVAQRPQGAGIGLYVARSLVEAMGGRMWIGDRPRGAEVGFSLPVLQDSELPSASPTAEGIAGH